MGKYHCLYKIFSDKDNCEKVCWEVESDNCLTRSKLYRREIGTLALYRYREEPTEGVFSRSTNYIFTG